MIGISYNEDSGFGKLRDHFLQHANLPFDELFSVETIFPRVGRQGILGKVRSRKGNFSYVFKMSQHIDFLIQHELSVMTALNNVTKFCPNFCRGVGGMICKINPLREKTETPFATNDDKYSISREILFMECINNSKKLFNYIKTEGVPDNVIFSAIKQTLLAISIAQKKSRFTHYDLHSDNIMMKQCDKDLVFLYVLDKKTQFCVPTHGSYPVVIDYGFAYAKDKNVSAAPLWASLDFTDAGFMCSEFDPVADPKLFLVTVSKELMEHRKNKNAVKLRNAVKNFFGSLHISWTRGWDKGTEKTVFSYVVEYLEKYSKVSNLFKKYDDYCLELIQSLILLPLQPQNTKTLKIAYKTFLTEFMKIENEISSPFLNIYILKNIVDAARNVHSDYLNTQTRTHAIDFFRTTLHDSLRSVAKFCRPKDIHYEKLLCSLFCVAKGMEGLLYKHMKEQTLRKKLVYKTLPLKTPEELCMVIDINIPNTYVFTEKSEILVIDAVSEGCYSAKLSPEQITRVNELESVYQGGEIYNLLFANKK